MLLSEYIAGLQEFIDKNGDMEAYYSSDDEGNSYQEVGWAGSLFYLPEHEQNRHRPSLISSDDTERIEEIREDGEELTPVCVVN